MGANMTTADEIAEGIAESLRESIGELENQNRLQQDEILRLETLIGTKDVELRDIHKWTAELQQQLTDERDCVLRQQRELNRLQQQTTSPLATIPSVIASTV
jgi:predicted  nucleic acid-binding Zn-ribbon protein